MISTPMAKKRAREMALQALYQWHMTDQPPSATVISNQFIAHNNMSKVDKDYFVALVKQVVIFCKELDEQILPLAASEQFNPICINILRIGCYELMNCMEIPGKVVVNEAINLAKKFGPTDSYKFVNAVMDSLLVEHRQLGLNTLI